MNSQTKIRVENQSIPLHTFGMEIDSTLQDIPFAYLSFDTAPALAQATYPHRHNFYEVLYVTGGAGTHYIDFNAFPIETNTFYFISPGQVHYWNTTRPIQGEIMVFTDDFLLLAPSDYMVLQELSFFHTVEGSPALRLNEANHMQLIQIYRAIAQEFSTYDYRAASVLRSYVHILLIQIQRLYSIKENKAGRAHDAVAQNLTRRFKQLVATQFVNNQSVPAYARQLGITVNHLNKTLKTTTGSTPGQLIRQEIILEAKRLIQHTQLTSTEIAYRLAFDDPSYFGRFFKREVGVTPGQFRHDRHPLD